MYELIKRIAATVLAGGYALSPIDAIPDIIPGLGQLDDVAVLLLLIYYWYSLNRKPESPPPPPGDGPVIDIKPAE